MSASPYLSKRGAAMPASPIRRLAPYAVEARKAGRTVFGLNIGQPDIPSPKEILSRYGTFPEKFVGYGPSQGLPEMLEALRTYYQRSAGASLNVEHLFVTTAGTEAIQFTFGALCDVGDEILVFEPFYTNYNGIGAVMGVNVVPVPTRVEDGYHLPPRAEIEKRIGPRTRAILMCSPNNPTGTVYTEAEMETLASICRDRGIFLVSDEVYREFVYDGGTHRSVLTMEGMDQLAIVVDSVSKRYSLCGARIGNIVSRNKPFMDMILRFGQARLCPPTVEQWACLGLVDVPASYTQGVIAEYQARRDVVFDALSRIPGVTARKPEGAFYISTRLPVDDSNAFAIFLLKEFHVDNETVMVAPLDGFYATPGLGRDEVRLAYVLEQDKLRRAMNVLGAALAAYPARVG